MAQPVFLKNFTLDGFNIGELFVVANVTIPFLSVERSYYTVGNTDGENLRSTRLNATDITIDGFLIKDFSGMSISETKDSLVAQVMSRQTQQLVFDALPDRYFNVVFDGTQEYDASDDNMTALTLTFKCPEGVAHSITPDVFRNVASTSANWLVDSEFQTQTFWNEDTYVPDFKRSSAAVLGLDYSEYTIDELENASTDLVAENVFYEDESMAVGDMWSFSTDYAILKKSDLDLSNDGTLEVVIDELDKVNGKVLGSTTYPIAYGSVDTSGQVMTAYAFDSTGKDRFSFEDNTMPNMYGYGVSEAPTPNAYGGSVVTTTPNQTVAEWGATTGRRVQITGGNNIIKGTVSTGILTVGGLTYTLSLYVKNNGTKTVVVNSNLSGSYTLQPRESKRLTFTGGRPVGASAAGLQFVIQVADAADNVDITIWRAKISANTEVDVWTDANQGTTDNTTPKYVGFSTTDNDSPSNKVLNGAFNSSMTYWTYGGGIAVPTFNGEYGEIVKSAGAARAYIADNRAEYELNGSVSQGSPVTGSVDVFLVDGVTGSMNSTELMVYFTYTDNTTQSLLAKVDQTKVGQWQTLTVSGVVANKPIARTQILFYMDTTLSGRIRLKNFMLTETDTYVPFAPHVTERGALYTWYAYGTSFNPETATFQRKGLRYRVVDAESKVLRLSINMYGNAHVLINRPNLEKEATATYRYIVSNKQILQAIPMHNYGTWKSYPTFEIMNREENGLIGIVNEDGDVLQFGNDGNVDATEPTADVYGLNETYRSTTRPSNATINSGHVSNYPYAGNNPDTPNVYRGSYDFKGTEVVKPIMPNIGDTNSWQGPSLTTTITAPSSGLRSGAFRASEVVVFNTDADKRGRMEIVAITDTNDIIMGLTIRDSDATSNEVILEYWFGNRLLKTVATDVSKFKSSTFRVTMERDTTGKKFNWNFENVQYVQNAPYKIITKNPFAYNSPVANKSNVVRTSRWLMKWREGIGQKTLVDKQTWTMKTNNPLNIRNSNTTNSRINGTIAKGVSFDTTIMKRGQKIVKDNRWFYVSKNTAKGIPASGWVNAYHLNQTKYVETKKTVTFDAYTKMEIAGSQFLWVGTGKPKNAKNPFKAGDKVVINTYDKTIFVNGVEREDLGTIGNMWEGFAFEPGEHYLRFVNSQWATNTMEVSVINHRTYL